MTSASDDQPREYWVFAYGSLIWKPGFDPVERRIARLNGFTRRFGLTSEYYRGTPEKHTGVAVGPGSAVNVIHDLVSGEIPAYRDELHYVFVATERGKHE